MQNNTWNSCLLLMLGMLMLLLVPLSAEGMSESDSADELSQATWEARPVDVPLAVLKGPTGFGFVHLLGNGGDLGRGVTVDAEVLPSPQDAVARLVSGEAVMAALPATTAALLYNRGVPIQLAAVTGEGNLFLMNSDSRGSAEGEFGPDFVRGMLEEGKRLYVPAPGSTPDLVTRYLLESWGFSGSEMEVLLDFSVAAPAQLAQLVIAGRAAYAVLPEPFATMAELSGSAVHRSADLQVLWNEETGMGSYPMTALVVQTAFVSDYPKEYELVLNAVARSIEEVNADPQGASLLIEEHDILSAALAAPSIERCALMFSPAAEAAKAYGYYLSVLHAMDPALVGGVLPDEAFYTGP
jgi:NitT/TauT family transport system substrate-binding protein